MPKETSTVKQTQTRDPRLSLAMKSLDWDNKHYLYVQKSVPGVYKSNLQAYLDAESPTRPGEPMYRIYADGSKDDADSKERLLAGGEDQVLLECSKEDEAYVMRYGHPALSANGEASGWQDALDRQKRVEPDTEQKFGEHKGVVTETISGGVLTG